MSHPTMTRSRQRQYRPRFTVPRTTTTTSRSRRTTTSTTSPRGRRRTAPPPTRAESRAQSTSSHRPARRRRHQRGRPSSVISSRGRRPSAESSRSSCPASRRPDSASSATRRPSILPDGDRDVTRDVMTVKIDTEFRRLLSVFLFPFTAPENETRNISRFRQENASLFYFRFSLTQI